MTTADLTALSPLLILAATAVVLMIAIAIRRDHGVAAAIALCGLAAAFGSLWFAASVTPRQVTALLILDTYSLLYMAIVLSAAAFVTVFAFDYLKRRQEQREEFYLLILLATTGAMVLVTSRQFASLFLGLEILSVSLYALTAYLRQGSASVEAGIKYLVLAASSSSVLLFGLALMYAESGSLELSRMRTFLLQPGISPLLTASFVLVLTGIGFKLAVVPFHAWTPDVYEGAPLPVTAFIATVSKGGMLALVLRWFHVQGGGLGNAPGVVLTAIAIASMLIGNLLALRQTNLKRILAYSSIAHMGYMLVALIAGGAWGPQAATYYFVAYVVTLLGMFGLLTVLSGPRAEAIDIEDFKGLFWLRPIFAATLTIMLLSLAGIPLTAGFLGKFYVVAAGASGARWILLLTLVVSNTIGLFYYLRIIVAMYAPRAVSWPERELLQRLPIPATVALALLTGLVFLLGVYPAPLWDVIQIATRDLG